MLREEADEALMILYQKGNVRAFEILLERHRKRLYNFILRYVNTPENAEDIFQESFIRVIKAAPTYEKRAKFSTWLFTIARNLCVDFSRRQKHRKHPSMDRQLMVDEESSSLHDVKPNHDIPTDRKLMSKRIQRLVESGIADMVEEQREVFLMREFMGMQFKEISEVVGVPVNTVKSRMRYALERLRLELDEYKDVATKLR